MNDQAGKCPFGGGAKGPSNKTWWPEALSIDPLMVPLAPAAGWTL